MGVYVRFKCGGCNAEADGTTFLKREFRQVTQHHAQRLPVDVQSVAPEGWVAFDPYTSACYCPRCWHEIVDGVHSNESSMGEEGATP